MSETTLPKSIGSARTMWRRSVRFTATTRSSRKRSCSPIDSGQDLLTACVYSANGHAQVLAQVAIDGEVPLYLLRRAVGHRRPRAAGVLHAAAVAVMLNHPARVQEVQHRLLVRRGRRENYNY